MALEVIQLQTPIDVEDIEIPGVDHLFTEDDTPVDNMFSEKQQRLLTESLYSSWRDGPEARKFLAAANIGLFYTPYQPVVVPDVLLSMDVEVVQNWYDKRHRSYFIWEFGKPPEVVIEIVSNKVGQEDSYKRDLYTRIGSITT